MNTVSRIKQSHDPDLYVRYLAYWRSLNGPRRQAPVRDIRPYLEQHRARPQARESAGKIETEKAPRMGWAQKAFLILAAAACLFSAATLVFPL